MDNYLTLKDAEATTNEWKSRAEHAEAACAFLVDHLKCVRDFNEDSPWDDPGACAADALRRMDDCGSGYVRREELEKLKARLDRLDAYPEEDENVQGFILDVLEQLEKRGVDTTNWDGDESSATIMAACVAGKIREKQEELDAAKAESAEARSNVEKCLRELSDMVKQRDAAKAELAKLRSRIRCIYCNAEYSHDQANELADHIMSCEKSPLVQLNLEIQSKANDLMDMTRDEFIRIAAISDNSEIQGICSRSQEIIDQKYPVIKQRDDLQNKLDAAKAEIARLREALELCDATDYSSWWSSLRRKALAGKEGE